MNKLYFYHRQSGRLLGFIHQDRPLSEYESRLGVDLTEDAPPAAPVGSHPYRIAGEWVLIEEPPRPAPPYPG